MRAGRADRDMDRPREDGDRGGGLRPWDYDPDRPSGRPRDYAHGRRRPAPYHLDGPAEPREYRERPPRADSRGPIRRDSRLDLRRADSRTDVRRPDTRAEPQRSDSRPGPGEPDRRRADHPEPRPARPDRAAPQRPPPRAPSPPASVVAPSRRTFATPVRVRAGPRPGTLARRARARPAPLAEREFKGCSPMDVYEVTVKLGQGTFGEVKKGKQISTGGEVALKKVTIYEVKDGMPITALREIKLLKALQHPSIVPIVDMTYRPSSERGKMGEVYMVEPYMDHDLNGLLENPSIQLPMNQIKLYMRQLLEGTLYMHKNKILHRDMKAANLLIDNNGQLQIADFGLARPFNDPGPQNYTDMVVTRWYRPPELLAGQRNYGPPVDMWGIGCILAEMVTGRPIFKGSSEINQLELIAALCGSPTEDNFPGWSSLPGVKNATSSGRPDTNPNVKGRYEFGRYPRCVKQHFTTTVDVGFECADLIDRLLMLDPCKRMTAAEALEHEWFWTKPYPADPASLPKYLPSKEIDRNKREWKVNAARVHPAPMPAPPPIRPPGPGMPGMHPSAPAVGSGAYPPMPRLPAAAQQPAYGRPKVQGWYNPARPAPRPY
ncbi:[pyruvate dehydrogenase (acetyl-transferring)] kinase [Malassezia sp. CBS 17886]|nr:[pyruvate dehydrogenase (acetyl-transferring)] kinase [Malassezia sp. CBS 17886]